MRPSEDYKPFGHIPENVQLDSLSPQEILHVLTTSASFKPDSMSLPKRIHTLQLTFRELSAGLQKAWTATKEALLIEARLKRDRDQYLKKKLSDLRQAYNYLLVQASDDQGEMLGEDFREQIITLVLTRRASEQVVIELKRAKEWWGLEYVGERQGVRVEVIEDEMDEL